jgi:hypothetical protein
MYLGSTGKNGDPYFEILAPIYEEFHRWREILNQGISDLFAERS